MIPEFPEFKKLEFEDKQEIEEFAKKFPPYSDFNFLSIWSWDVDNKTEISYLNGNLVVWLSDYIDGNPLLSFLGNAKTTATIQTLLDFLKARKLKPELKLVPEDSFRNIDRSIFKIIEDRDNFDYIVSVERMRPHDGTSRPLSSRRKLINIFIKNHGAQVRHIDINDPETKKKILNVALKWEIEHGVDMETSERLKEALGRMLSVAPATNVVAFGLFVGERLIGYSINEIVNGGYAVGSFQQADILFSKASYALLMQEACEYFHQQGCAYLNLEQDMGIEGLRAWKESCMPVAYLKKYRISIRT